MKRTFYAGDTDKTIDIFVLDSSSSVGAGLTGLAYNTSSLVCYYRKGATGSATVLTLATQTVGGAHSDGGFVEVASLTMPGMYRLDLSDTVLASEGSVTIMLFGAANMAPVTIELQVLSATRGLAGTALPDAAADAAGGLPISDAGGLNLDAKVGALTFTVAGKVDANVLLWTGNAVTVSGVGSKPDVNVYSIEGVDASDLINSACDTALADYDGPTNAEMVARTLLAADYFDPAADTVANVTTVGSVTGAVGSISGIVFPTNFGDLAITVTTGLVSVGTLPGTVQSDVTAILADTNELQTNQGNWLTATGFSTHNAADVWAVATRLLTAGTNIVLAKGVGITGLNDLDAAGVRSAVGLAAADLDTQLSTIDTVVDGNAVHLTDIKGATFAGATDSLEAIRNQGDAAWVTATGFSTHSAADVADAVWDEAIAGHLAAGSTGEALNAAGAAGDPWTTSLPGAYGAGSAGKIVGDNLNATVSSRATQTSVDTIDGIVDTILVDTAELQTNQGNWLTATGFSTLDAADVRAAIGLATANLDTQLATIASYIDTEIGTIISAIGALNDLSTADIDARLAAYDAPTKAEMDAAFVEIKGATWSSVTDTLEALRNRGDVAWVTATGFSTLDAAGVRAAVGLAAANLDIQLAAILVDTGTTLDAKIDAIQTVTANLPDSGALTTLLGSVAAILADTGTDGVVLSSATMDAIANAMLDLTAGVETNLTIREHYRLATSVLLSLCSGMGTASGVFRDFNDTKNRVTVTTDANGNRLAIARDAT